MKFHRGLILASALAIAGVAAAGTLVPLQLPADLLANGQRSCVGVSVGAGDVISGFCQSVANRPQYRSSYIYTFSADTWDSDGNLISETYCGQELTAGIYKTYTYQPGFDASSCVAPWTFFGKNDMLIGDYWYGYVTTASDGSFELVMNGHYGTIYKF